jgi:hypothetical protein
LLFDGLADKLSCDAHLSVLFSTGIAIFQCGAIRGLQESCSSILKKCSWRVNLDLRFRFYLEFETSESLLVLAGWGLIGHKLLSNTVESTAEEIADLVSVFVIYKKFQRLKVWS